MHKVISTLLMVGMGFMLQGCAPKVSPQESCNFVQNSELQRVAWGSHVPVIMYVDKSVPEIYYGAIQNAAATWNKGVGHEVIKIGGVSDSTSGPTQDGASIIYFLNSWESDRTNEQARTTVYWTGNRIYEADIRVNAHDFKFFWGTDLVSGRVDIESLVLHEMGHVLGLAHNTTETSVMAVSLPSAYLRRDLYKSDLSSVKCEY